MDEKDAKDYHRLGYVVTSLRHVLASASSRVSRLLSSTPWGSVSTSQENWTLYQSAALLVIVITGLRVSKGWCFGNGMYLRRRVLLLAQIRAFVVRWEARCLAEVEACCADVDGQAVATLTPLMGPTAAARVVASWATSSAASPSATAFYGITSSVAFSAEVSLEEVLELAYMGHHVLHLRDDRAWLQRLVLLLEYMLLRRVSLMEEVRLYAQLHQRVLFPNARSNSSAASSGLSSVMRPTSAWRLHRSPTWLVPLCASSPCASYFCLPLSYFPVEALLPYTAAESWLSDRLVDTLLPEWRRGCKRTLKAWGTASLSSSAPRGTAMAPESAAACKISYWFLRHAEGLLHRQLELHRRAAQRFYTDKLYALAYPSLPQCAAGIGDAALVEPRRLPTARRTRGSLRLLWSAASDWAGWGRNEATAELRQQQQQRVDGIPESSSVADGGRAVRRALLLRAASQGLSITLQVCVPRMSLRHVTEVVAAGYCMTGAADPPSASPASPVEALLRSLVAQMVWTTVAGVAEVFLHRWVGSMGSELAESIAAGVTHQLEGNLLHVDEAFLRRWLRGAVGEHGGTPSSSPPPPVSPRVRLGSAGSYLLPRPLAVDDVLSIGRRSGEKVMAVHDAVVKRWLRVAVLGLRAAVTREWRPLLGALATSWVDVPRLTSAVSVRVGYSLPQDVARLLSRRDESLPTRSPAGLRLLLEVMAEEQEGAEGDGAARLSAATTVTRSNSTWEVRHRRHLSCSLPHPYLALVVCANVWSFDHLLGESQRSAERLSTLVVGVRRLHTMVSAYSYAGEKGCPAVARDVAVAMQEDARCVAYYSLHEMEQSIVARQKASPSSGPNISAAVAVPQLHPLLDAEETLLLQTPSALAYLPDHVDYFDLFSLPYRFILRQLGLEMVFAYRTATGMQQESRQMAEEWWTLTLFNSTFNPLTSALQEGVQLLASCGTVLLLCVRVRQREGLVLVPTTLADVMQASHSMDVLREVLRGGVALRRLEENVCPAQQLCEWLPQLTWSEYSMVGALSGGDDERGAPDAAVVSTLQQRRRQWRRHLLRRRPELLFDRQSDRIVGGLRLQEALRWHHVYFSYPQLYSATTDKRDTSSDGRPAVRPTLVDVTFSCPAAGMTAVVGPSGAGKSSLNALLCRLYDPVPVIDQGGEQPSVPLWNVGLFAEAEDVLLNVLRLALIEHALPPPPPPTESSAQLSTICASDNYGLSLRPGLIALDDIPLQLFSVAYIRQWFAWLPQTPTILPQQSFLSNVRVVSPFVTFDDAQRALQQCGCDDFIADRQRTVHDKAGPLSGGEGQRLALARVVAGIYARRRVEVIQSTAEWEEEEEGEGDGVGTGAVGGLLLDEPTSRLDAVNELRLLAALTALQGTATSPEQPALPLFTWMISHRQSSLRSAAFMVVVEDGAVTATGVPREVRQRNVFAQKQWEYQRLNGASECDEETEGVKEG